MKNHRIFHLLILVLIIVFFSYKSHFNVVEASSHFSHLTGVSYDEISGQFIYYEDDMPQRYTGLAKRIDTNKWVFVKDGVYDNTYSGLAKNQYGWFFVKNGNLDLSYTGITINQSDGIMYYVKNGVLDRSFTGLAKNEEQNKWYYAEKGVVRLVNHNSISKGYLNGIDISNWQSDIRIEDISADFVIAKATEGIGYRDPLCEQFYLQAITTKKKFGFYHFARPVSDNDPIREAQFFFQTTKHYFKKGIPILDWEADNPWNVEWAKKWLDEVYRLSGVKPIIYMNQYTENTYNWLPVVSSGYKLWIAKYGINLSNYQFDESNRPSSPVLKTWNSYVMWQYTSNGYLNGYAKNLDFNVFYGDVYDWDALSGTPTKKEESYTGLAKNQYGWFYVNNSILDRSYTGLAKNQYGWFYVKNGVLDRSYTGLAKNQYGWFYVKNGVLDRSYTGLAKNQYGWFYVTRGVLDRSFTGVGRNQHGLFYVKNGVLDRSFNGQATDKDGILYNIRNGVASKV